MAIPRIEPVDVVNIRWSDAERGVRVTVRRDPLFDRQASIFTMGSCFAVEVRAALREAGFDVGPRYYDLVFDPDIQAPGKLPDRDNLNHYDTFTIRQEIERALEGGRWSPDTFWHRTVDPMLRRRRWADGWQDPFRRQIFARSREALIDLSDKISGCIDQSLARADILILTLGLTECWRDRATGHHVCMGPRDEHDEIFPLLEFHQTGFGENYGNLRAIGDAVWQRHPGKRIVLTVSPVALGRTWTGQDVVTATTYSKSVLRAVAGELAGKDKRFVYWPSYEFAGSHDVFEADGRHVRKDAVAEIMAAFVAAHVA